LLLRSFVPFVLFQIPASSASSPYSTIADRRWRLSHLHRRLNALAAKSRCTSSAAYPARHSCDAPFSAHPLQHRAAFEKERRRRHLLAQTATKPSVSPQPALWEHFLTSKFHQKHLEVSNIRSQKILNLETSLENPKKAKDK
jgi:hypothetical protein